MGGMSQMCVKCMYAVCACDICIVLLWYCGLSGICLV